MSLQLPTGMSDAICDPTVYYIYGGFCKSGRGISIGNGFVFE